MGTRYIPLTCCLAALTILLSGCPTPPPPDYTPANSAEAETACPGERLMASRAREGLLLDGSELKRKSAARAVYSYAYCERRVFLKMSLPADDPASLQEGLKQVRAQFHTARTIFTEIEHLELARWAVGANAGIGALHATFAKKLTEAAASTEQTADQGWADITAEIRTRATTHDSDAARAFATAITAAEAVDPTRIDPELRAWIRASCSEVARIRPDEPAQSICTQLASRTK